MEGAATTVYAQGGRGNARLVAWEGERTVTFTMEDALISPIGFSILSGAGLIEASEDQIIVQHVAEQTDKIKYSEGSVEIELEEDPAWYDPTNVDEEGKDRNVLSEKEDYIYVMLLDSNGEVSSEPFLATRLKEKTIKIESSMSALNGRDVDYKATDLAKFDEVDAVLVDYYVARKSNAQQIEITADKFGGTYYLEASTLFRDSATGKDMPAEFIIPKCKIQSNFTFTMASSGDPSTFTFTMDAFPDYTRFDRTKKVLAAIQIISELGTENELRRINTKSTDEEDINGIIIRPGAQSEGN